MPLLVVPDLRRAVRKSGRLQASRAARSDCCTTVYLMNDSDSDSDSELYHGSNIRVSVSIFRSTIALNLQPQC